MGIRRSDPVFRAARGAAAVVTCLVLANCASQDKFAKRVDPKYGVSSSPRVVALGDTVPKGGGTYRVGKPYTVAGRVYVPEEDPNYRAEGMASWYGDDFHGRLTANGEVFDMTSLTAAHPTLPIPSYARVTNIRNGKSLIVRVNDRGPYHGNRLIDVSNKAAELLEFKHNGVARVRVEYVGRAPLEGSDDRQLVATLRTGTPAPAPSTVRVAAARPFVPEVPSGGRAIRGDVPLPEDVRGAVPLLDDGPHRGVRCCSNGVPAHPGWPLIAIRHPGAPTGVGVTCGPVASARRGRSRWRRRPDRAEKVMAP